jgi:hypothetical protein
MLPCSIQGAPEEDLHMRELPKRVKRLLREHAQLAQETIVFLGAILIDAKEVKAAKALLNFLRTPEAVALIKAKGMEPATP